MNARLHPPALIDDPGLVVDLFAGGGGASTALEAALGRPVDIAINHSPVALAVHAANHPKTRHFTADVFEVRPTEATGGRPVAVLWLSPDCTHFSIAKGDVPRDQGIRSLADVGVIWAKTVRPRLIFLENVQEWLSWGPLHPVDHPNPKLRGRPIRERRGEDFERWKGELEALGYTVEWRVIDASRFGAPTKRRRLFLVARCDGQPIVWPDETHGPGLLPFRTAVECIDWSVPCPSIFTRKRPLAAKTLKRIALGIQRYVIENPNPFLIKVNHGRDLNRSAPLDAPISTITASQRGHALVVPTLVQTGYGERKGQEPRSLDIHAPLGACVAGGQKHALVETTLVAAHLVKSFGDPTDPDRAPVLGSELTTPLGTVTARDHHSLAAVTLVHFRGTSDSHPGAASVEDPLPTITAGGTHVAEVRAFLREHAAPPANDLPLFNQGRDLEEMLNLGLVTINGVVYQIVDIGLRMLEPHELLRAQFGRFAANYDLSSATTKSAKVRLIGNSVAPEPAEAVIAANIPREWAVAA